MRAHGRLRGFVVLDAVLTSVAYYVGVCYGSSVCLMRACHEGCMSVSFGVRSLGSMRYSVPAKRSRVDLKMSMVVRSCILRLILSP